MHEIVTLQLGQQANYAGAHYWNTQESYFTYSAQDESPVDHDVSFRAGVGADGAETYTPRTVIYDLKGAFGTLRRENALYELQRQEYDYPSQWSGSTIPMRLSPISPSAYQQALDQGLDLPALTTDTVRFWSDYNHVFYHPRSIIQLNEYELNSSLMPFERWKNGEELFCNLDREHDLLDRDLRPFLEECDHMQGIQVLSSTDDAWGGFASTYLERISDELGKGCRWFFGLQDMHHSARERHALRLANVAQSLLAMNSSVSTHVPLSSVPSVSPSYLSFDALSRWHTSALQAAAMESVTLPTRLKMIDNGASTFDSMGSTLNGDGLRCLGACAFSVDESSPSNESQTNGHPDSRMTNGYHEDQHLEDMQHKLDVDLFPASAGSSLLGRQRRVHWFSTLQCFRETPRSRDYFKQSDPRLQASGPRMSLHQTPLLFPKLSSYPDIFRFRSDPHKLAIRASLTTSTLIADYIRSVGSTSARLIAVEERETLRDGLASMADEYVEGWESDDMSDDDGD